MEKIEITLAFDGEKLDALEYALRKERTTVQKQMDEALRQLYEAKVPEAVRDYLDNKNKPTPPKRPPRHTKGAGGGPRLPGQQEQAHAAETAAPAYQSCRFC